MLLHLVLRWDDVVRTASAGASSGTARTPSCSCSWCSAILGGAQLDRVAPRPSACDLTKDQRYSLSDQTRKVLAGLKDDVKITYFQRSRDLARGQDRLKEYQALSPG